jgi:hypothetical protein
VPGAVAKAMDASHLACCSLVCSDLARYSIGYPHVARYIFPKSCKAAMQFHSIPILWGRQLQAFNNCKSISFSGTLARKVLEHTVMILFHIPHVLSRCLVSHCTCLHPPKFVISFPYNCLAPNSVVLVASRLFSHVYFSTSQINFNLTFSVLLLVHVTPSDEATCRGVPLLKDHTRDALLLSFALPLSPTIPTTNYPCPVPGARFYTR